MELFTLTDIGNTLSKITDSIGANIAGILIVFGTIVGVSIVAALIDVQFATFTYRGKKYKKY